MSNIIDAENRGFILFVYAYNVSTECNGRTQMHNDNP